MTERSGDGGVARRTLIMGIVYTALIMAFALTIIFTYGSDARGVARIVYVGHAIFYSACLGGLLAAMFHAAEEH